MTLGAIPSSRVGSSKATASIEVDAVPIGEFTAEERLVYYVGWLAAPSLLQGE